jgi:transposase
LLEGSVAQGYRSELWTTQRIAEVIEAEFGVRYHRDHVALERDEEAIERWKRETWPEAKKTPRGWMPTSSSRTKAATS